MTARNSPSRKSGSGSKRPNKKLRWLLKRGAFFRQVVDDDLKWIWAAYRKGTWHDLVGSALGQDELFDWLGRIVGETGLVLLAPVPGRGTVPVGIMAAVPNAVQRHLIEPHVTWFPWSTPRNRMEAIGSFLHKVRQERNAAGELFKLVIAVSRADVPFYTRLMDYGLIGRCGWFPRLLGDKVDGMIFYSKELG